MRILIASNRFFISGGPERYLFNIFRELGNRGHHVVPFALGYPQNEPTHFSDDFPQPPIGGTFVRHGDRTLTTGEKARLAVSVFRNPEVRRKAERILRRERIDVIYALQIAHYLYPEIFFAARELGIPVVWRQSDFQMICPAYNSYRNGGPCHDCDHGLGPALKHRCLKNSTAITAARVGAMVNARWRGADWIPKRFVCPSRFLMERLRSNSVPEDRLVHLPTPVPMFDPSSDDGAKDGANFLLVGGMYEAKGPQVAIEAAIGSDWNLWVAGDDNGDFAGRLKARAAEKGAANVVFLGSLGETELRRRYHAATAVIVPSLWEENVPNVVLETHASGTAVIASNLGSLPEVVGHGVDGLLFSPGDVEDLRRCVNALRSDGERARALGLSGRERVRREHKIGDHVTRLEALLGEVIG